MKMIHIMLFMISKCIMRNTHRDSVQNWIIFYKEIHFYIIYILCVPEIGS